MVIHEKCVGILQRIFVAGDQLQWYDKGVAILQCAMPESVTRKEKV